VFDCYRLAAEQMRPKKEIQGGVLFTYKDAQLFRDLFDVLEGVYGAEAPGYFQRYIKLWPHYKRLKENGVNVRMSPPRFCRRPLLIIDR
jgi:hypothetical protein